MGIRRPFRMVGVFARISCRGEPASAARTGLALEVEVNKGDTPVVGEVVSGIGGIPPPPA